MNPPPPMDPMPDGSTVPAAASTATAQPVSTTHAAAVQQPTGVHLAQNQAATNAGQPLVMQQASVPVSVVGAHPPAGAAHPGPPLADMKARPQASREASVSKSSLYGHNVHTPAHTQKHAAPVPAVVPPVHSAAAMQPPLKQAAGPIDYIRRHQWQARATPRHSPCLLLITAMFGLFWLFWFATMVTLVSLTDEVPYITNESNPAVDPTYGQQPLQTLIGPLQQMAQRFFYPYGLAAMNTFLACAACWAATVYRTRQMRAVALFAATWVCLAWFLETEYLFQALNTSFFQYCDAGFERKWCNINRALSAANILVEFAMICLFLWALFRFIMTHDREPNCELDAIDIQNAELELAQGRAGAGPNGQGSYGGPNGAIAGQNTALASNQLGPVGAHTDKGHHGVAHDTPAGPTHSAVPVPKTGENARERAREGQPMSQAPQGGYDAMPFAIVPSVAARHVPIRSLRDCRLSPMGSMILFFCVLSVIGFAISMLSNIELQRSVHYPGGDGNPRLSQGSIYRPGVTQGIFVTIQQGDYLYRTDYIFTSLLLFFAIGMSVACAYERVREAMYYPLLLTFLSSMAMWSVSHMILRSGKRARESDDTDAISLVFLLTGACSSTPLVVFASPRTPTRSTPPTTLRSRSWSAWVSSRVQRR
jgi:hypothetical protein